MFVDARTVTDGPRIECDISIIGPGAAGLSIVRECVGSSRKICVAQSGGLELEADTQTPDEGDNIGLPYFSLGTCRLRQFGGTTNHWGGY